LAQNILKVAARSGDDMARTLHVRHFSLPRPL